MAVLNDAQMGTASLRAADMAGDERVWAEPSILGEGVFPNSGIGMPEGHEGYSRRRLRQEGVSNVADGGTHRLGMVPMPQHG